MKGDEDPSGARNESQSSAGMDVMDECSSNSKSYPRMFLVVLVALPMLLLDDDDGDDAKMGPSRRILRIFALGLMTDKSYLQSSGVLVRLWLTGMC